VKRANADAEQAAMGIESPGAQGTGHIEPGKTIRDRSSRMHAETSKIKVSHEPGKVCTVAVQAFGTTARSAAASSTRSGKMPAPRDGTDGAPFNTEWAMLWISRRSSPSPSGILLISVNLPQILPTSLVQRLGLIGSPECDLDMASAAAAHGPEEHEGGGDTPLRLVALVQ